MKKKSTHDSSYTAVSSHYSVSKRLKASSQVGELLNLLSPTAQTLFCPDAASKLPSLGCGANFE